MKGRAARCRAEYRIGHRERWSPNSNNTIISIVTSVPLGPQFSLSVGGDCTEGWGEDTVSRPAGVRSRWGVWGWGGRRE